MQNFIDSVTGLPRRFGELYSDRDIKIAGQASWDPSTSRIQTIGVRLICSPVGGGAPAITAIPDGYYSLSAQNTAVWVQVRRTSGTTTVVLGSTITENLSTQPQPRENWIQLFSRTTLDEIISFGSFLIPSYPSFAKFGLNGGSSVYDAIVGPVVNPYITHTSIQQAIDDVTLVKDGGRILILPGTYNLASAGNPSVDATAALSWSSKTLTIEGSGYGTILVNTGGLARAFAIVCSSNTPASLYGNGSCIKDLQLSGFAQSINLTSVGAVGFRNFYGDRLWLSGYPWASYLLPGKGPESGFLNNSINEVLLSSEFNGAPRDRRTRLDSNAYYNTLYGGTLKVDGDGLRGISVKGNVRLSNIDTLDASGYRLDVANGTARIVETLIIPTVSTLPPSPGDTGRICIDTTKQTLNFGVSPSTWITLSPIPVGGIIPVIGAYSSDQTIGANQGTGFSDAGVSIPSNFKLCDGTIISDTRSPFNGRYVPMLTDQRFLQGTTVAATGPYGGAGHNTPAPNVINFAHTHPFPHTHPNSHTHAFPHRHNFTHNHVWLAGSSGANRNAVFFPGTVGGWSNNPVNIGQNGFPSPSASWEPISYSGVWNQTANSTSPTRPLVVMNYYGNQSKHAYTFGAETRGYNPPYPAQPPTLLEDLTGVSWSVNYVPSAAPSVGPNNTYLTFNYTSEATPGTSPFGMGPTGQTFNTTTDANSPANTGDASSTSTGSALGSSTDIRPKFISARYYMRVF